MFKIEYIENTKEEVFTSDFKTEKELCDFIEQNRYCFVYECLDAIPNRLSILGNEKEREYKLNNNKRIDFNFSTHQGNILVECKNSSINYCFIGQLLEYYLSFYNSFPSWGLMNPDKSKLRCVLVLTKYKKILIDIIKFYNLPFEIIILTKKKCYKIRHDDAKHDDTKRDDTKILKEIYDKWVTNVYA